jgi:hypothetical protein
LLPIGLVSVSIAAAEEIEITPIGAPLWRPVDVHLFSAAVGTAATGFAEFAATTEALLPPPNHRPHPGLGIGPGDPHSDFDREFERGLANLGLTDQSVFNASGFTNGMGVFLAYMLVLDTGAPAGSSPDFVSGPIIANSLFPLSVNEATTRGGVLFSPSTVFPIPALNAVDPPFDVEGHSHIPVFYADTLELALAPGTSPFGSFIYTDTMLDAGETDGGSWPVSTSSRSREHGGC